MMEYEELPLFQPQGNTLEAQFLRFDRQNPHVYRLLVRLAREWVRSTGGKSLGIKALYERARWEVGITTDGDDDYTLNNNYTAFYARKIMENEPDLRGLFALRKQKRKHQYQH